MAIAMETVDSRTAPEITKAARTTRLSQLCCGVFPGQVGSVDFFACRPVTARWFKSGGDQDAAELGGHVGGGGLGLAAVAAPVWSDLRCEFGG
jgi:hypothetical protein